MCSSGDSRRRTSSVHQRGYGNVPIRQISSHIGYSAAALYRYFPTKDDIFNALAEEGLQLLMRSETSTKSAWSFSAQASATCHFWGVFDFAKRYPEYYYLLFLDRSTPRLKLEALDAFRQPMRPHLREILDECADAGRTGTRTRHVDGVQRDLDVDAWRRFAICL